MLVLLADVLVYNTLFHRFLLSFVFITSAKEVIYSSALVCLLAGLRKNYSTKNLVERWRIGHGRID